MVVVSCCPERDHQLGRNHIGAFRRAGIMSDLGRWCDAVQNHMRKDPRYPIAEFRPAVVTELEKWFDVITEYVESQGYEPPLLQDVDIDAARAQIGDVAKLVSQTDPPPFSVRDNHGTSGQADAS